MKLRGNFREKQREKRFSNWKFSYYNIVELIKNYETLSV